METISVADGEVVNTSQQSDLDTNGTIGVSVVQVAIPNQPVQVQSVIQPNQPSVIQTASGQTIQTIQVGVGSDGDGPATDDDSETKKRREILARRPSYRKIYNELSSDPTITAVQKIEEESNSSLDSPDGEAGSDLGNSTTAVLTQDGQVVPASAIQIATHGDGASPAGLQTLTMTNVSGGSTASTGGATLVQYAQGPEGQFFIPVTLATSGSVQYQIATTPTTLPQSVVMATTGGAIASPQQVSEEASRKRELRLLKNREAARECRRKKKEYVKCLENRVAVLENQNKALIEELKSLKELYCQKEG